MLIFDLEEGDTVCIGPNISVTYVRPDGDRVRLGVAAPRNVRILRAELKPSPAVPKFGEGIFEDEP